VTWKSPLSTKFLGNFSPIVSPSAAGFGSVASDAGDLLWRKLERSNALVLLQVGGWTCRWQRHSVKPSCWECSTAVEQAKTHLKVVVPIEEERRRRNEQIIDNQIHLINCAKTLSINSLLQAHRLGSYLVYWHNDRLEHSAPLGMPLLFQCFLLCLPTAKTMVCILPFSDLHDTSTLSSTWYGVPATIDLSLQLSSLAKINLIGYSFSPVEQFKTCEAQSINYPITAVT
jgi:hypothetical protein